MCSRHSPPRCLDALRLTPYLPGAPPSPGEACREGQGRAQKPLYTLEVKADDPRRAES